MPHLILRTSWVYVLRGKNFLLTISRLAKERDELTAVDDQVGAPTWCSTIADVTSDVPKRVSCGLTGWRETATELGGVYHASLSGQTS